MKIWAHRGCSQRFPENTMTAFSNALKISGLTGIELDIQMTKDGEIVVIHDERVDRTTNGIGYVKDYTYLQLRSLRIETGNERQEKIPAIKEVLDLLNDRMEQGFLLNIELKNSCISYEGMENKIFELISQMGLCKQVVFSSFYTKSIAKLRQMEPKALIGILDTKVSECLFKKIGVGGEENMQAALHPFWKGIDLTKAELKGQIVRAWFKGHLYPEKPTGARLDLIQLEDRGITDVFLNEPEAYLP